MKPREQLYRERIADNPAFGRLPGTVSNWVSAA